MEIKRVRNLATEIFKSVNNLNPSFMKNIFTSKENARVRPNNLVAKSHNSATYGNKRFMARKFGMHFQKKSNLKHYTKSLRNSWIYGLDPNVDVTFANPFTIEYFIKLLP